MQELTIKPTDFYGIEELLSDDERMVRDTVRRFVDREVMPHIGDWWLRGEFPKHLIKPLGDLGLLGANLPAE